MRYRRFGATGWQVSEIGLGTWQLGGGDWGDMDDRTADAIVQAAADCGVNFFDTADVYGLGASEERVGRFLRRFGAKVIVATKLGRFPQPGWPANFTPEGIRQHTEASLRRLGVGAIDLTQLHCIPTDVLRRGEVFDSLRALQREGKIRRFGVSVESMEEAAICLAQEGVASLQIIFNIFRQKPIDALFEEAKRRGVALIVRLPLASGLLSGKFAATTQFAPQDHRSYNRDGAAFNVGETFAGLPFKSGVALAERIRPLVPEGMTMAEMAVRWCLDHDAVSTVIPGATREEQVAANCRASDLPSLPRELHERLREFYRREVSDHIRGPY